MENAAEALKISFAVFVFVLAIAITFSTISKAKTTSDVVLYYADKTNFYQNEKSKEDNREVDLAAVITTLYKASEESIVVSVIGSDGSTICEFTRAVSTEEINKVINDNLNNLKANSPYIEDFIEVSNSSGIYKTGDDGTQVPISDTGKRIYITYYEKEYYNNNIKSEI